MRIPIQVENETKSNEDIMVEDDRKPIETNETKPSDTDISASENDRHDDSTQTVSESPETTEPKLRVLKSEDDETGTDETEAVEEEPADPAAERDEWKDRALRAMAEIENTRRRAEIRIEQAEQRIKKRFLSDLMDLTDDLERALKTGGEEKDITQGLEMIHRRSQDILGRYGIQRIADAESFDPEIHEATAAVPMAQMEEGKILAVERTGYRMGECVLRPARVVVVKNQ